MAVFSFVSGKMGFNLRAYYVKVSEPVNRYTFGVGEERIIPLVKSLIKQILDI